jgi:DNA polymerase I-like protein with 3'-5' exonuclease and polymerase domains
MLLNIHDAVIFEIKDNLLDKKIKEIYTIMNNPLKLKVPLVVDVEYGKNLGEMKKYNI